MKILVGKTFGIGNAVLSIPMLRALSTLGEVDVLVGSSSDDIGAASVFLQLQKFTGGKLPLRLHLDRADDTRYDVAVMAIPFDGRWQNGVHYKADRVIDGRKRPGNVERLGLDMWLKHEAEYQLENAVELGYSGELPSSQFVSSEKHDCNLIYVGIGFKRDPGGFGRSKHFGNERLVTLMRRIRELKPGTKFISSGGLADFLEVGGPIAKAHPDLYTFEFIDLGRSFDLVSICHAYIGNDTGMMHVAASCNLPTYMLTALPGSEIKNPPLCERRICRAFDDTTDPHVVAEEFVRFIA